MKRINIKYLTLVLILIFVIGMHDAMAQPPGFGDDVDDTGAPINGLIGIALAVGAYFGARKLKGKE